MSLRSIGRRLLSFALLLATCHMVHAQPDHAQRWNVKVATTRQLNIGGATLQIDFADGPLDLTPAEIMPWVERAATAVTTYYGRFPVPNSKSHHRSG